MGIIDTQQSRVTSDEDRSPPRGRGVFYTQWPNITLVCVLAFVTAVASATTLEESSPRRNYTFGEVTLFGIGHFHQYDPQQQPYVQPLTAYVNTNRGNHSASHSVFRNVSANGLVTLMFGEDTYDTFAFVRKPFIRLPSAKPYKPLAVSPRRATNQGTRVQRDDTNRSLDGPTNMEKTKNNHNLEEGKKDSRYDHNLETPNGDEESQAVAVHLQTHKENSTLWLDALENGGSPQSSTSTASPKDER